jgi:glutamyl/glutaminyl-tRNA synthetase
VNYQLTRLAPTPSGYLHLGNLFSFVITSALARKHSAGILLRIDDLDQARCQPAYLEDIFDSLNFLGFSWQKGPKNLSEHEKLYSQVHRIPYYRESLSYLIQNKKVFACDCSRKKIAQQLGNFGYPGNCSKKNLSFSKANTALRVYNKAGTSVSGISYPGKKFNSCLPENMSGFIVQKKDKMPSYQLSSMLDDVWYGVDLVVRGSDLYPSTLAQLYLSSLLPHCTSFHGTTFYHPPLMFERGRKMAKSKGSTSIMHMREKGMDASDIFNELGRNIGITQQVNSLDSMISLLLHPQVLQQVNQYLSNTF